MLSITSPSGTGLAEMTHPMRRASNTKRQLDDQELFQLFLIDPNGVKVEQLRSFASVDITADVRAVELAD